MANLFNLLANTGNKITDAKNALFNRLVGQDAQNQPQLDVVQFGENGDLDAASALQIQNRTQPLTPRERLFGRELEQNVQTINPESNSVEMSTIRDFRPGLLNDIAGGYNENRNNPISMNNFGQNTLDNGRKKGFAYRLGEGLGSLARIGESPLGRSLLVGGLVGATGGSGLEALAYGAQTGMLNQQNRNQDKLYRDDLIRSYQQSLENSPEFVNLSDEEKQIQLRNIADNINSIRGYMTPQTYSNMIQSNQLRDNAAYRKMYYDNQQQQFKEQQEWRKQQAEIQRAENAANRAVQMRGQDLNYQLGQERLNAQSKETDAKSPDEQIKAMADLWLQLPQNKMPRGFQKGTGLVGAGLYKAGFGGMDTTAYDAVADALATSLARKNGEKGNLSDSDIKRWRKPLPNLTDTPEQAQAKFDALHKVYGFPKINIINEDGVDF